MVVLQQVLQEQERHKQSKILVEVLVFSLWSQIVQISTDTEIWLKSLKDSSRVVFGDASMSSIEFYFKFCQWWLCKSNVLG